MLIPGNRYAKRRIYLFGGIEGSTRHHPDHWLHCELREDTRWSRPALADLSHVTMPVT